MKIYFFERKPRNGANFSIESIFTNLRNKLKLKIESEIHVCSCFNTGLLNKIINILEVLIKSKRGICHITGEVHYLALLLPSKRTILTIHDCGMVDKNIGLKRIFNLWLYLKMPLKNVSAITTVSEATKAEIIKYTNCSSDLITVIPVQLNSHYYFVEKVFCVEKPRILQIGTGYNKNIPNLIMAIKGLSCHLIIIGKLTSEQSILLENNRIEYTNLYNLTDSEMFNQYQLCDIVTFASTFEGFGMPIIEANAVGRVVLTSNVSSMPEVASDAACLVNPFDVEDIKRGLRLLIDDEGYRKQLISNGILNAKRFDERVIAESYYQVYKKIHSTLKQFN